jgi:uncharacterized protein (DUF1015 family)
MAEVIPLRGCLYNPAMIQDMGEVLCPPYDMIAPELHEELKRLSNYNAVHLEGGEQPDPETLEIDYKKASELFQQWLSEKVLVRDEQPCFYLMKHGFEYRGQTKSQLGLFANIGLADYDENIVFPHEFTREPAVLDRVALLEHSKTQFSPIMTNYRDSSGALRFLFNQVIESPPILSVTDSSDGNIDLWRISDHVLHEKITEFFKDVPLFLADGHHRYEAALRYQRLQKESESYYPGTGSDYVMMSLVEFDDPGLLLLPYHRIINGLTEAELSRVREALDELFEVQPVRLEDKNVEALLDDVAFLGSDRHALAMIGPRESEAYLLMLRPSVDWQSWGKLAISEAWVLEEKILRPILGDRLTQHVNYGHDHQLCVDQVLNGEQQLGFLLKPFPMDAFETIVGQGQKLPSKSTFFYPKLPTGLVINQII